MASKTIYVPPVASGLIRQVQFKMKLKWLVDVCNVVPNIGLHSNDVLFEVRVVISYLEEN